MIELKEKKAGRPRLSEEAKVYVEEHRIKLGKLIKKTRKLRKLTIYQVAEKTGMRGSAISFAERKGKLEFSTALRLCKALNADLVISVRIKDLGVTLVE